MPVLPMSLRTKLILSFSAVILVGYAVATLVGWQMISKTIISQAQEKVSLDINTAWEVFNEQSAFIKDVVRLTADRTELRRALRGDAGLVHRELARICAQENLDIFTLVDAEGYVVCRAANPGETGDVVEDAIVRRVRRDKRPVVSPQVLTRERLEREGPQLAGQAEIITADGQGTHTSGMVIKAAAPVFDANNELLGILYGGVLLNNSYAIVDTVKDIVYKGEKYKGHDTGTATIFLKDLRISTNVLDAEGNRAVGTRVSDEVLEQVVNRGIPWNSRAYVLNNWYRTAYQPIRDIQGRIIGMLYVGMLEAPYVDLKKRVLYNFLTIGLVSVLLLGVFAVYMAMHVSTPIHQLVAATERIAGGELGVRVPVARSDEIGQLAASFNQMSEKLLQATHSIQSFARRLKEKVQEKTSELEKTQANLVQAEKLASLGKLAAGIAHEINNPLTSILINSHLVAEQLQDKQEFQENLDLIISETTRCSSIVRGLLEFSRQTEPQKECLNVNRLIEQTLSLLEKQLVLQNVHIARSLASDLPNVMVDANKLKQVFTNIILNAVDAMPAGGTLTIHTAKNHDGGQVEITFSDTGVGMDRQILNRVFDPFFSTKGIKGTGLGLAVSYGIVQQHNGAIGLESSPGKGTTATVRLPGFCRNGKEIKEHTQ